VGTGPPDTLRVQTADNVSLGYSTAGVGSRMAAQLIDSTVALALVFVALVAAGGLVSRASTAQGLAWGAGAAAAFAGFVYFGYFLVYEAVTGGRTLGKRALGLRVVRIDGSAPDVTAILVRDVVRVIDLGLFGVGIVVMFFHPLSRRLGDLAAGTVVVRERSTLSLAAATAPPPVILRTPDAGPPIEGIERLGTSEHNALRVFLSRPGLTPQLRAKLAGDLATRLYERLQLPPHAPERMWPPELLIERLYLQLDMRSP